MIVTAREKYNATIRGVLQKRYHNIMRRCNDPRCKSYNRYGGRGIECRFNSFEAFVDYVDFTLMVDPRGLHIHRMDNDGHYERGNIEFLTPKEHRIRHTYSMGDLSRVCQQL